MKITEELFNKACGETVEFIRYNCKTPLSDYYADVMRYLLKKEVSYNAFLPIQMCYQELSEDNIEKLSEYITTNLCEKYNLTKGIYHFSPIEFKKDGEIKEPFPSLLFGDDLMLSLIKTKKHGDREVIVMRSIFYTSDSYKVAFDILKSIQEKTNELLKETKESDKIEVKYSLVYTAEGGFYEDNTKRVKTNRIELSEFNQDLPDDKIQRFIKEQNESGILIFHGEPGCGKTSYIKYLIQTNQDKQFSYLGIDMLMSPDKLREYVITRQKDDLVIVVEDCERLLQSRNYGSSSTSLSDILNISDGLIGDQTNTKFIFTFNSNIGLIDSALLRKGRLKCRYEFKPLHGDRLKSLAHELGLELSENELESGLPLCDLYNYGSEVETEVNQKHIGFIRYKKGD